LEEVLKILHPMTSTVFWSIIVFGLLLFVIWRFVARQVNNMLKKRKNEIQEMVNSAEQQKDAAERYLEEKKQELEDARKRSQAIIEGSKEEAKKIKDEIEEQANQKSKTILEAAQNEIKAERERSVKAVRDEIVDIALDAAKKIIGKSLSKEDHKKLIEESLKEAGKKDLQ